MQLKNKAYCSVLPSLFQETYANFWMHQSIHKQIFKEIEGGLCNPFLSPPPPIFSPSPQFNGFMTVSLKLKTHHTMSWRNQVRGVLDAWLESWSTSCGFKSSFTQPVSSTDVVYVFAMTLPLASADQRQTTHVTAHLDPCVMLAVNTAGSAEVPPFSFLSHKE